MLRTEAVGVEGEHGVRLRFVVHRGLHALFSRPQLQQLLQFDRMSYIASLAAEADAQPQED